MMLTVAICTYNNAPRLPRLISELRNQECPVQFEILVVDNNSSDGTQMVLEKLKNQNGPPLRCVVEVNQGISFARNRAIEESLGSEYLFFIDDDELPQPGWISAAINTFHSESAQCIGGRIRCVFYPVKRPDWLENELLGFLGEVNYGSDTFIIKDKNTPIWTGNIAYKVSLFTESKKYRFDTRYNREGKGIGGGEDVMMFQSLLNDGIKMIYCPAMIIEHYIEPWRLKKRYFLKLHFNSGRKFGQYQSGDFQKTVFGIPFFMISQTMNHLIKTLIFFLKKDKKTIRQAMNFSHAAGMMYGRFLLWQQKS